MSRDLTVFSIMRLVYEREEVVHIDELIEKLNVWASDPGKLAKERESRFNIDTASAMDFVWDTHISPFDPEPLPDKAHLIYSPKEYPDRGISMESRGMHEYQFLIQARREKERLLYQRVHRPFGRRQTLPWDDRLSLLDNSKNNVRKRWIDQGIWRDEWGPAWPRGDQSDKHNLRPNQGDPIPLIPNRWGHKELDQGASGRQSPRLSFLRYPRAAHAEGTQEDIGRDPLVKLPTRDPEASRPYRQFLRQMQKELGWVLDEFNYREPNKTPRTSHTAFLQLKRLWVDDGIWSCHWDDHLPGLKWRHESTKRSVALSSSRYEEYLHCESPLPSEPQLAEKDGEKATEEVLPVNTSHFEKPNLPEMAFFTGFGQEHDYRTSITAKSRSPHDDENGEPNRNAKRPKTEPPASEAGRDDTSTAADVDNEESEPQKVSIGDSSCGYAKTRKSELKPSPSELRRSERIPKLRAKKQAEMTAPPPAKPAPKKAKPDNRQRTSRAKSTRGTGERGGRKGGRARAAGRKK